MATLIKFLLFTAFITLILVVVIKASRALKKEKAFFKQQGFVPCPTDEKRIIDTVNKLLHTETPEKFRFPYRIDRPLVYSSGGKTIYCYTRTQLDQRHNNNSSLGHVEFLFPFGADNAPPCALFFELVNLPAFMDKLSEKILSYSVGPDLARLEVPKMLEGNGIIAAFGPAGSSLYDLLPEEAIKRAAAARAHGVNSFITGAGLAEIAYMSTMKTSDPAATLQLVKSLAGM